MGDPRAYQTKAWQRLRAQALRVYGPTCHACGNEIDLTAPPRTPTSYSLDHLNPVVDAGTDVPHIADVRPVHYGCNSSKKNGHVKPGYQPGATRHHTTRRDGEYYGPPGQPNSRQW